jgi:F5/8 type C domain
MIQGRIRGKVERAVETMRTAERSGNAELRLQLARQGTLELVAAYALSKTDDRALPESIEKSLALVEAVPNAATRHALAIARLKSGAPGALAETLEYDTLVRFFIWLEARVETRTAREIRVTRWLGRAALALGVALASYLLFGPKNLARGAHVTASSTCSLTPEPELGRERLSRVVDGRLRELSFAVCTETEQNPWVTLDLGLAHRIDRVVVYPRNDCCYGEDELPLELQLSQDDVSFDTVGTRSVPAVLEFPWRFSTGGREARYVRITVGSAEPRHVVLSEVEVYGS